MQLLFALTLFTSATLLFVVQPMFAKMVLPLLGGTPAVWNTCMVFYQATLLAGYVYAHLSIKWLGPRRQAAVHMVLFCLPWVVLPIGVAAGWTPPAESNPIPWLLLLLAVSVGLPFLFVSASAPMLQAWFAHTGHRSARDPYFLYAASNLGSILALLGYPLLLEPFLTLDEQAWTWTASYGLLMGMTLLCAVCLWRWRSAPAAVTGDSEVAPADRGAAPDGSAAGPPGGIPTWGGRVRWLALSFAPSSLLLGVTTYLATDIASVPLLWVIPLALYLLTFVLVFARRKPLRHRWMVLLQPILVVMVAGAFFVDWGTGVQLKLLYPLHLVTFFVIAMVCHGELAADRPASRYLTEFYLWMSLGGVLGGIFNALVAPLLFSSVYEYPLMIAVACLLRPAAAVSEEESRRARWFDFALPVAAAMAFGFGAASLSRNNFLARWAGWLMDRLSAWGVADLTVAPATVATLVFLGSAGLVVLVFQRRPVRFGLGVFALLIVSLVYSGQKLRPLVAQRGFFGVLRVKHRARYKDGILVYEDHQLLHGSTSHGIQSLDLQERREPWTYYHRTGPVGQIFDALDALRPPREIGVVGLGTGTIAAYGRPGQRITFYEIDPAVVRIAENPELFTYLSDCREDGRAEVEIVLGDARLSLAKDTSKRFDLLLVDAFSSDAIPVHLLTREALALYFDRLAEHGVLAVHISNRYLDLKPVLGNLAADPELAAHVGLPAGARLTALVCRDKAGQVEGKSASIWVAVARRPEDLGRLAQSEDWKPLPPKPGDRLWTDDFSNIMDVLNGGFDWRRLLPWTRKEAEEDPGEF